LPAPPLGLAKTMVGMCDSALVEGTARKATRYQNGSRSPFGSQPPAVGYQEAFRYLFGSFLVSESFL